jgi:hypothetical protein
MTRPTPAAQRHGDLQEVLPNIYFVTGSMKMGPLRFSRNMVVIKQGDGLVLVNSLRLNEAGLAALDALGTVTDVIRLAGFHGSDDPFYKEQYGCTSWAMKGSTYFTGVSPTKGEIYFTPDKYLEVGGELPVPGATLYRFDTDPPEGLLRIDAGGGTVISGDSLQNWGTTNRYFNLLGKLGMTMAGFLKPHQLGKGWVGSGKPSEAQIKGVLDLEFQNLLPAHGDPVIGDAREKFRPSIEAYDRKMD